MMRWRAADSHGVQTQMQPVTCWRYTVVRLSGRCCGVVPVVGLCQC